MFIYKESIPYTCTYTYKYMYTNIQNIFFIYLWYNILCRKNMNYVSFRKLYTHTCIDYTTYTHTYCTTDYTHAYTDYTQKYKERKRKRKSINNKFQH